MLSKKLFHAALLAATTVLLFSCNEDKEESFEALADVYYINKVMDGEVTHATYYYVYGNNAISSATVKLPGGETIELDESFNLGTNWANEPDSAEYSTEVAEAGSYLFDIVTEKGETYQVSDVLSTESFGIPEFTEVNFVEGSNGYTIKWDDLEGADAYLLRLLDDEGKIVFSGYTVNEDVNEYPVIQGTSGYWQESPSSTDIYLLQLLAYSFDEDADNSNYIYNLNQISMAETEIVWGE